jgi:hypothetical protein
MFAKPSAPRRVSHQRRLRFESLEGRELFAATVTGSVTLSSAAQSGVTLNLFRDGGNGTYDNGAGDDTLSQSTVSATSTGTFSFSSIADGTYFISEVVPSGQTQASPATAYKLTVVNGVVFKGTGTTIDSFTSPASTQTFAALNTATQIQQSDTSILGAHRKILIGDITTGQSVNLIDGNDTFELDCPVFGSATATLLYDGTGATSVNGVTSTSALSNSDGLGGSDLTNAGQNTGLRIDLFADHIMQYSVTLHSASGTATFSGTENTINTQDTLFVPFTSFSTTGTFSFAAVTSAQVKVNTAGTHAMDVVLQLLSAENQSNTAFDFANRSNVEVVGISGKVYEDLNKNGVIDTNETSTKVVGAIVTLTQPTNTQFVAQQQIITSTGMYSFTGLTPGVYKLTVTAATNMMSVSATPGLVSGQTTGTKSTDNTMISTINLTADGTVYNFGEMMPTTRATKRSFLASRYRAA